MRRALLLAVIAAASAYVIGFGLRESARGVLAFDVYFYFYPHVLHALRSLADGGRGLLWNPFQNCGQPFFANAETALIYPPNLLFLVLDGQTALRAVLFINLVIGGLGTYALGRALRVSAVGSLGAALAFILGTAAYNLTTWMPTVQAAYVWMPVAMWRCERLLRAPDLRRALLLGLALAAPLLAGHPQFVLFICQMIALRLLWSLLDGTERHRVLRALGGVGVAMVVMLLLASVQFLPAIEVAAESVRSAGLRSEDVTPGVILTLENMSKSIRTHSALAPFTIIPSIIAAAAIVSAKRRGAAYFYLLTGVLFLTLAFGDATPLWRFYYEIPLLGNLFRMPFRFQFVTGFCVAVLTGLAIDVLAGGSWLALASMGAALTGLYMWLGHVEFVDWWLAAAVLGSGLVAAFSTRARPIAVIVIVATIGLGPVLIPTWSIQHYLTDDAPLRVHSDLFERLRTRLTPQDRVELVRPHGDVGFQDKTATLLAVRAISDYELQETRRYAEYFTMLRKGRLLTNLNEIYYLGPWNPRALKWPLLDLAATRYLMVHATFNPHPAGVGGIPLTRIDGDATVVVYENPRALPRAYYVPQLAVEPDAAIRLRRLAAGREDRRRLALIGEAPGSGFLGVPGNEVTADARFALDDPEHVRLEVVAPERGFLFLADQYFPGWLATVNGQPTPILIGNHAFRLVEVPKGAVTVEFRYRPRRVWVGLLISGVSLLVVVGMLFSRRASRRPTPSTRHSADIETPPR